MAFTANDHPYKVIAVADGEFYANDHPIKVAIVGGGAGGDVNSVNGKTGDVVLDATDVGALPDTTTIPTKTSELTNDSNFVNQAAIDTKADLVNGKIPESQLPAFVDDVLTFDKLADFPATGEDGKIYIAKDTNLTYRWSGTAYVSIASSLALGETVSTAYRGDRGKIAYDHTLLKDNPHTVTKTQVGLGNVDNTSDANKPISTAQQTALNSKMNFPTANTQIPVRGSDGSHSSVPFSQANQAGSIAQRSTGGTLSVGTPTAADHAAHKQYVDTKVDSVLQRVEVVATLPASPQTNVLYLTEY